MKRERGEGRSSGLSRAARKHRPADLRRVGHRPPRIGHGPKADGGGALHEAADGGLQAALAWAALQRGDLSSSSRAVHAALKLAPDYPDVRYIVARWYLAQWEALSAEDQQVASGLVQRGARELPQLYVDASLQLLRDLKTVRSILPSNPNVRRLLLNKLTEQGLFADRWAEQRDHPYLRGQVPTNGLHALAQGLLVGREDPPTSSRSSGVSERYAGESR